MSFASDDLTPVLAQQPAAGVRYRQGTVREWNPDTAANVVDVDGALFENLSILNTNEAVLLAPGDVVGILVTGQAASSWCILGRLTIPGTPAAATALSMVSSRIVPAVDSAMGTRSSATYGNLTSASVGPSVQVTVGQSGKALAFFSCQFGYTGAWESHVAGSASVAVSGATTVAASGSWGLGFEFDKLDDPPSFSFTNQCANMHLFTDLTAGVHTFTMQYRSLLGQAIQFLERELCVFAL